MTNTSDTTQAVTVDAGDLDEAMQSANAWASELRSRAAEVLHTEQDSPDCLVRANGHEFAANRIDKAVARLRRDSHNTLRRTQ
jgi:hypothetical protein